MSYGHNNCVDSLITISAKDGEYKLILSAENVESTFREHERFRSDPKLDGSVVMPPGVRLTVPITYSDAIDPVDITFSSGSIVRQPKKIRNIFKKIRRKSEHHEFGSLIIEYEGGTSRVIFHSSKRHQAISLDDVIKSLYGSLVLGDPRKVKRVVQVHSHPRMVGTDGTPKTILFPSDGDYEVLKILRDSPTFNWSSEGPHVEGIVLPICENCNDLFIHYLPDDIELPTGG